MDEDITFENILKSYKLPRWYNLLMMKIWDFYITQLGSMEKRSQSKLQDIIKECVDENAQYILEYFQKIFEDEV
ncbi:MAG: hypothetical protein ACP6IY_19400 [Promethearchaeia archaeon]